jgi:hypothetical protein
MGPDVISGLMDSLAESVQPLLKDGEKFVDLHFGLEVFPDENSGVCVFVITCGEGGKYGKMGLRTNWIIGKALTCLGLLFLAELIHQQNIRKTAFEILLILLQAVRNNY